MCTKSYANGLGAIQSPPYDFSTHQNMNLYASPGHKTSRNWSKPRKWCAFLLNLKIGYIARWHLFATPDYLGTIYVLDFSILQTRLGLFMFA